MPTSDPWLPHRMFGGSLPADERPLNAYLSVHTVFRSPADKGEPLWWFDTADYQARATCQGLEVTCRVSKTSKRMAAQVVLRVALLDTNGQTLAANPLASVADLEPGQSRETPVLVTFHGPQAAVQAHVEVSLVRWQECW